MELKKIFVLIITLTLSVVMFATSHMNVREKSGKITKFNVDSVTEVVFLDSQGQQVGVVDASETPFVYNILTDSTAEIKNVIKCEGDVVIPNKVQINGTTYSITSIGEHSFSDCSKLTNIEMPEGVEYIGYAAFENCSGLASLTLPKSIKTIEPFAFVNCSKIPPRLLVYNNGTKCYGWVGDRNECKEVIIPTGVKEIGASAFPGCSLLTKLVIPDGVKYIGESAFGSCRSLSNIVIPESVDTIGYMAFPICDDDIFVCNDFKHQLLVYSNGTKCYGWIGKISECKEVEIPNGVTSINAGAFRNCFRLKSVKIPSSVTNIGTAAFQYCGELHEVSIPSSVKCIGDYAFGNCSGLTKLEISDGVSVIGDNAFEDCDSLTEVKFPQSIKSIGQAAFSSCDNLTDIDIPSSVKQIAPNAFASCRNITPQLLLFNDETVCYGWVGDKNKCVDVKIPSTVISIADNAFSNCTSLENVSLPSGLSSIGSGAFSDCISLKTIDIPKGVTHIGNGAFSECFQCPLDLLIYDNGTKCYGWVGNNSKCKEIVIPEGVTSIGMNAFANCRNLTDIKIPESVTVIGDRSFNGCEALKPGLMVYNHGKNCLGWVGDKSQCKEVVIPDGVEKIDDWAFYNCSLEKIKIPSSVTSIGKAAFLGCYNLGKLDIPSSVTFIGGNAFEDCYDLDATIYNPKDKVVMEKDAFPSWKCYLFTK